MKRSDAIKAGLTEFIPTKACTNGHLTTRHIKRGCLECDRQRDVGRHADRTDVELQENRDRALAWYRALTPEQKIYHAEAQRQWRRNNPDKLQVLTDREKDRYVAERDGTAPARRIDGTNRAPARQATPAWANRTEMAKRYHEARGLTRATGILHVVDHEIPLRGPNVCGLHVENNLQVITGSANKLKGNSHQSTP